MKTEVKANNKKQPKKNKKINTKKQKQRRKKTIVFVGIFILIFGIFVMLLFSNLFRIKQITVENNNKVSTEEIIQNSHLIVGENMFKTFNYVIKNGIKTNPYIEDVKVRKKISGDIIIEITERTSTFILQDEEGYIYINNQGYILEKNKIAMELPEIKGYKTLEMQVGARLNVEDLKKLEVVIQIMETAKNNGIMEKISVIDITDAKNYILQIPSEGKNVQFGDETNINVKILWIIDIMEREKGIEGDIILNVPNIQKIYFREKV